MEKHTVNVGKVRLPQIKPAFILQAIAIVAIVCIVVWIIFEISAGIKEANQKEAEYDKADTTLKLAQQPEIIIHQPSKLEIYYPEIKQEIDGTSWTRKSSRYLISVKHVARVEYSKSGELYMAVESGRNRYGPTYSKYWFRNLTYEEWNTAVSKLEWKQP